MTREEYQNRFWDVSDEKWKELEDKGLIPDKKRDEMFSMKFDKNKKSWQKYAELMQRRPDEDKLVFDEDEILFMGAMDLSSFAEKFPAEADSYMLMTE